MSDQPTELQSFLSNPRNSVTREKLLYHRLYFDLKIAAAEAGYHLTLFEPDVDRDGYDVVIDDGEVTQFVQLKTVLRSSKTSNWAVKRTLLGYNEPDDLGYQNDTLRKAGYVVIIEMDAKQSDPTFSYYVTDIEIIRMISQLFGLQRRQGESTLLGKRRQIAVQTLADIEKGEPREKCKLSKSAFLKTKDPSGLLVMLGLYSKCDILHPSFQYQTMLGNGLKFNKSGEFVGDRITGNMAASLAKEILLVLDEPSLCVNPTLPRNARIT